MKKILFILIIVITFSILIFINNKYKKKENFTCNQQVEQENSYQDVLSKSQKNQIEQIAKKQTMSVMNTGSQFMTGPKGPQGPQGMPGGKYQALGRLVNQKVSYSNSKSNAFLPNLVTTRTSGTIPTQSLLLMDTPSLASFQYWYLNNNNTIESRFDGKCLNYNPLKSSGSMVYMGECEPNNFNQWVWDKDNRIFLRESKDGECLYINNPESNITTTSLPGCKTGNCIRTGEQYFLKVKKCDSNKIFPDEMWSFI